MNERLLGGSNIFCYFNWVLKLVCQHLVSFQCTAQSFHFIHYFESLEFQIINNSIVLLGWVVGDGSLTSKGSE